MTALPIISSLQNRRIKDVIKLRDRRGREKQGRFLIDGTRELAQALAGGIRLQEAFVNPKLMGTREAMKLFERLLDTSTQVSEVSDAVWDKLTFGDRKEGILAVASHDVPTADMLPDHGGRPIVILDRVEKPGNTGAVLRSADATGVTALALADPGTDLFNPNTIRASLGTVFRIPVFVDTAERLLERLKATDIPIFVTRVDAEFEYFDADLAGGCALVFGSEADGVCPVWRAPETIGIRLPMGGAADSLNVSTSAAAVLYEALRQRRQAT